jgi:N-acetylneuraminic acid mutarotase
VLDWHLPHPVSREVAVPYAGRVLLAGGLGPGGVSTARVLDVDLRRGSVHRQRDLATAVHDSAGALLGGGPTVFGGGGSTELDDVQQMDLHGRWRVVGHLPEVRSDLSVATPAPRRAVVVGGYDGRHTPTTVLVTTDGSHFSTVARLPTGIRYAGVGLSAGHLWVLGGEVDGHERSTVLRIDVRTGQVRRVGRLPRPLGHEAVAPLGGRLLVLGGRTAPGTVTSQMWWYDPHRGRWSRAGRLPHPVADSASVSLDGSFYLLGGETPDFTADVIRIQ